MLLRAAAARGMTAGVCPEPAASRSAAANGRVQSASNFNDHDAGSAAALLPHEYKG